MGPILRCGRQSCPDRVHADVMRFFDQGLVGPQPMVEKSPLPDNAQLPSCIMLPIAQRLDHTGLEREAQQSVNVVRHENDEFRPPKTGFAAVKDGLDQSGGSTLAAKAVISAGKRANRDEERGPGGHPGGYVMRKFPALR